jgi:hypothetical protein
VVADISVVRPEFQATLGTDIVIPAPEHEIEDSWQYKEET